MSEIKVPLKDKDGNELLYDLELIFAVEGTDQLYCAVTYGDEAVLLRCDMTESGENMEIAVSDIPGADEYAHVAAAYQKQAAQEAAQETAEALLSFDDFISLEDTDGNKHNFIAHLIFADEVSGREYIAVQEVNEVGTVFEEIALYRFKFDGADTATIEMIPSDMEYEVARGIFMNLLETDSGVLES